MKSILGIALIVAATAIAGCSKEPPCTPEIIAKKAQELNAALQESIMKDPTKVQELSAKVQELATKYNGADDSQACKAYDDLLSAIKG